MRKEEFYFDSRDNQSRIHALRYTPEHSDVVGIVQIIHGMAEYVERYEEWAQFLTDRHFVVVGEDHLGHGKSVAKDGLQGYFCEKDPAMVVVQDNHRLKKMTQEMYPGVPYFILGHSMGSFILRNYICHYSEGIEGAIIMGTGAKPSWLMAASHTLAAIQKLLFGDKHVSKFLDQCSFRSYNSRIKPQRTPFDWLTREEEKVDFYLASPDCGFVFTVNGFRTLFTLLDRSQKRDNIRRIRKDLPVFLVAGEEDPVGTYGRDIQVVFDALQEAGLKSVSMKLYPGARHELLNETNRQQVMQDLYEWLSEHLSVTRDV